ncbi:MAG: hypothetical protein ACXWCB_16315 [Acidimicrobiales bacterium]
MTTDPEPSSLPTRATRTTRTSWKAELAVFLLSMVIVVIPTVQLLAQKGGNVTALLNVGEQAASRPFVERDFSDIALVERYGHDGQQFYVVARSVTDLQQIDGNVDRPRYRARRILLPLLASPFPAGAPTVWAMFAISLVAVGMAGVAAGRLARRVGGPVWLGLAVALTPALLISVRASLGDVLAFSLALWGVVLWRRHLGWAVLLFALAALARETTLVAPAACLLVGTRRQRLALVVPFAVYGAWALTVSRLIHDRVSHESASPVADALRQFAPPFQAWRDLGLASTSVLLALALTIASLLSAWVLRERLPELAIWLVADVVLVVISGTGVAEDVLNYARLAPLAGVGVALAAWVARSNSRRPSTGGSRRVEARAS